MDAFSRTTKQIAAKYKENLTYWYRPHYLRTIKLTLFVLAIIGSLAFVFVPHKPRLFSTGPISANHAQFEEKCEKCHVDSNPSLLSVLNPVSLKKAPAAIHATLGKSASLDALDQACHKCHEPFKFHQPQILSLNLASVRHEITGAQVDSCSSCHREHQGPARMPPPPNSNCVTCHSDQSLLESTMVTFKTNGKTPPKTGEVKAFRNDGVLRFVPPRDEPHQPVSFASFEKGHPLFGYEQTGMRDPAVLKFNHARHAQNDIRLSGRALLCQDCHKPGADGVFMQPVTYADNCASCHSLHFSADVPELTIPHHDPEKVRNAMQSSGLTVLFLEYAVKVAKITETPRQQEFIAEQFRKLQARGIDTTEKLLIRVFRTGDPPNVTKDQAFPACAKCHEVKFPGGNATPLITPTNVAQRWLTRGPFTHAPHTYMECTDCHQNAGRNSRDNPAEPKKVSSLTSDILMPSKSDCALCHRPLDRELDTPIVQTEGTTIKNPGLVDRQYAEGGVASQCQFCHPRYHAPAEAAVFAKGARKLGPH